MTKNPIRHWIPQKKDHRPPMLRNVGYCQDNETSSPMEHFTALGLTRFWEGIAQRLTVAKTAMETLI